MKSSTIRLIALLFSLIAAHFYSEATTTAPATTYFKVFDMSAGLPDNSVNDIVEDDYGFLWVATWNGLARFDGKNVVHYRHIDESQSLSNNMVRCLLATPNGIWVGSDFGLDFFRFSDSRFFPSRMIAGDGAEYALNTRVSRIMGHQGNIFILSVDGEILRLDPEKSNSDGSVNVFRQIPKPLNRTYADFTGFTRGRVMALSNEGITILSADGERELLHNRFSRHFDSNMNIYCDTIRGIVYAGAGIGSPARIFEVVSPDGRLNPAHDPISINSLMRISQSKGVLYMATDGDGLYALSQGGELVHYTPYNSSLPCDAIYTVFTDSHSNVWCGTYRHGLCMLSHELNAYTLNNIASGSLSYDIVTAIVPQGNLLYLGLDGGGLDVYDSRTGHYKNFNVANSQLPGNNVVSLLSDGDMLWGAVYSGGLISLDPQTSQITTYQVDTGDEPGNKLWIIEDDKEGHIWAGGVSLHVFNKKTKKFRAIDGCVNIGIMSIADDGKYMWVATRQAGVLKIDKYTYKIEERYSTSPTPGGVVLPGNHSSFIYLDSRRNLWINMGNKTLLSINIDSPGEAVSYGSHQGLTNTHVCSMAEDQSGNLWIGTDDGLFKYIRESNLFVRKKDSRVPQTYTPNATAVIGDTAYFGTTGGMLSFPMTALQPRSRTSPTVFTCLTILDEERTNIPLYTQGDCTVELDHDQNFFTVSFTVPEMSNPDQMQFECRLEGLEDVWRDVSSTRYATYTNVPQGTYRMLVRHTNPDGTWNEPASMGVRVRPAWYSSVSMMSVWVFLIIIAFGAMLYIWQKYIQNQEKTRVVELERDTLKQLNDAKLDFYATISHELRTPCFLISAQIEEILDSERQTIPVASLNGIYRNSAKLNKLINHIIDFRKNDTGLLKLYARPTELVKFLGDLTYDYEQLCRQKSLEFSYEHDNPPIEAVVDPDKLEQIVTNLISNAYKYTPKGGKVSLSVKDVGSEVAVIVADTGIGVVDKLQTAIFQPFYRTERGQNTSSGDGIGLAFVKELVEMHNGHISLESHVNEGSVFTVILPKEQPDAATAPVAAPRMQPSPQINLQQPTNLSTEIIHNPTATRSILIVDDDPEVTSVVARAFEDNYRVWHAANGATGIEMASTGDFDVIITDLMMPEADGHQLVKSLKADKKTRKIKIVVFSALAAEEDMVKAFDEGADAYLTKPTPLKVLRRQVDRLFETSEDPETINSGLPSGSYNREEQKFLLECRRVIEECMTDENFGIEMLAAKLAMSHSTLYKKIRKMTGMSLIDFINEYRICKAVSLFRNGNTNVQKVSELCGFRDIKTFRETFKRKMNMPPKQYILQINQE